MKNRQDPLLDRQERKRLREIEAEQTACHYELRQVRNRLERLDNEMVELLFKER